MTDNEQEKSAYWAKRCHDKDQEELRNSCICATTASGARPTVSFQLRKTTDPRKDRDNGLYIFGSEDAIAYLRNAVIEECAKVCDENAMRLFDGATKPGATALQITAYQIRALT